LEHLATKPRIRPTLAEAKGAEPFDVLVARNDVEGMLAYFMDEKRLRRAKEIPDKEVVVEEADETGIHARIRTYTIIIDLENREILHDCADWSRVSAAGQFCKHVGKLFLSIPVQQAIAILTDLYHQRDSWLLRPLIGEEA
ncbi:hypothetical protein DRN94_004025, partial [archaeon]|nr:hypothetical protein [archaeon]